MRLRVCFAFAVVPLVFANLATAASNETCAGAVPLTLGSSITASTDDAADSLESTGCGKQDRYALWYSFDAPATGRYRFDTKGTSDLIDTTLLAKDTCEGNAFVCIDDTTDSISSAVEVDMIAGQHLVLRAAGWGATRGELTLTVNHPEVLDAPSNDLCASSTPITTAPGGVHGNTLHSTGTDVTLCGTSDSNDIWYSFIAPETKNYEFFLTQNMIAGNFVSVHGSCGADELACGLLTTNADLTAGQTVWIRVGTDPNAADQFNLNVGPLGPALEPSNDEPTGAKPLGLETVSGSTLGATKDSINFGPTCGPFVNATVWYSFTAPEDGTFVFDTSQSSLEDTIIGVFGACTGPLPLLACDADSGKGLHARIDGFLMKDESVCLAVGGHLLSEIGDFQLSATKAPDHPPNDHCDLAEVLSGFPVEVEADNYTSRVEALTDPCPTGEFALWYSFTAPVDGWFKFDTKESTETSPDIALYSTCDGAVLECSSDPLPVVSRQMTKDETVLVRLSTNVFWRSPMVLRIGPEHDEAPSTGGSAGTGSTGGTGAGGEGALGGASSGGAAGTGGVPTGTAANGTSEGGGCGCRTASSETRSLWAIALALLALVFRRRRTR